MIDLIIDGLAAWRLASLLFREAGPWEVFKRLRDRAGVVEHKNGDREAEGQIGKMFCCFWCTSVWSAVLIMLLPQPIRRMLALSALAIFAGWIGLWLDPDEVAKRKRAPNTNGRRAEVAYGPEVPGRI